MSEYLEGFAFRTKLESEDIRWVWTSNSVPVHFGTFVCFGKHSNVKNNNFDGQEDFFFQFSNNL